jgi:hypothetical protein
VYCYSYHCTILSLIASQLADKKLVVEIDENSKFLGNLFPIRALYFDFNSKDNFVTIKDHVGNTYEVKMIDPIKKSTNQLESSLRFFLPKSLLKAKKTRTYKMYKCTLVNQWCYDGTTIL